jgi:hypothetical protein
LTTKQGTGNGFESGGERLVNDLPGNLACLWDVLFFTRVLDKVAKVRRGTDDEQHI